MRRVRLTALLPPALQSKLAYLLMALVLALAIYISTPADAQDTTAQQWEYAHVITSTEQDVVFAYMDDVDEQTAIQAELDALPKNQVGTLTTLNILGNYGWELAVHDTSQQSNGFLAFILKRPVD